MILSQETIEILKIADKILTVIFITAFILIAGKIGYLQEQKKKTKWRKEWEEKQATKEQEDRTSSSPTTKFMTQTEFEKWKTEQKKNQGGYLDLNALAALFKRRAA